MILFDKIHSTQAPHTIRCLRGNLKISVKSKDHFLTKAVVYFRNVRVQLLHTCANKNCNSTSMKFCLLPWNCFFLLQASSTACKVCSAVARRAGRLRSSSKRDWDRRTTTSFYCIIFLILVKNSLAWVHIRVLKKGNLIRCINFDF